MSARVIAVHSSRAHTFSKLTTSQITLLTGLGVEGDGHGGVTVKHRSRVTQDPSQPNLRQVHLIHSELFDELAANGFAVAPGQLGENITTLGVNLLALPVDTELHVGRSAVIRITGLRNPCMQLDQFQMGLMSTLLGRGPDSRLVRKSGVMGVVVAGGPVCPEDRIEFALPVEPHRALERV